MRKLMVLLILVLGMGVSAQTTMFKAEKIESTITLDWQDAKFSDPTGTILLSYNSEVISVHWPEATIKYYIRSVGASEEVDVKHILFQCIDSKGVECMVGVSWYKDKGIAYGGKYLYRWRILYDNQWFGYYCNPIGVDVPKTAPKKQKPAISL